MGKMKLIVTCIKIENVHFFVVFVFGRVIKWKLVTILMYLSDHDEISW